MRRLASDSLIYGLGSVANQALAILLLPLYTRFLTPADYGSLALISAAGAVLGLAAALGVNSGLTRIFFLYESGEERASMVFTALVFAVGASVATGVVLSLLTPDLRPLVFSGADGDTVVRLAIWIYCIAAVNAVALGTLQVHGMPRPYVLCSAAGLLVSMLCSIYLVAFAHHGVVGVLQGQLAGITVQLGLATSFSLPRMRPVLHLRALREMLAFSIPILPTSLFAWGLGLADRWSLKEFASLTEVGLYALGYRFGAVLDTLFVAPFTLAWYPYFYSISHQPDHRDICARVLEYYTFLGGCLVLALDLFGGDVIRLIATPAFYSAKQVIFWIGLGSLFRGMTFLTGTGMNVVRKNQYSVPVYGAGLALNLALLFVLVPRFGMMGAAFAVVLTYAAINAGFWVVSQRVYPIPFRPRKIAVLIAVLLGLHGLGGVAGEVDGLVALPLKVGCLGLFPLILFAARFFDARDVTRVREIVRRITPA